MERFEGNYVEDNLIEYNGKIITSGDLESVINRYLSTLINPADIYKNNRLFNGMLLYIYKHLIIYILPNSYNNDYELFDSIFNNIYIPLCYLYNHIPTVSNFCILIHIDYNQFYDIKSGTHIDGSKVNNNTHRIIQKWISICNSELLDNIIHNNSIGSMFLAKVHGFREDNITNVNITVNTPQISESQLNSIAKSGLPMLPDTEN